jgi:hypothetical protein
VFDAELVWLFCQMLTINSVSDVDLAKWGCMLLSHGHEV